MADPVEVAGEEPISGQEIQLKIKMMDESIKDVSVNQEATVI